MADTNEVPTRGPQNIKRHLSKFSRPAFVSLCATRPLPGKLFLYCLAQKVQLCRAYIKGTVNPVFCKRLHLFLL